MTRGTVGNDSPVYWRCEDHMSSLESGKGKGCCSPKYRAYVLWPLVSESVVWGACKSHTAPGDLAWKRLWIIEHQNLAKWSFLHCPPHLHILGPKTYFEAYIFEICLQQSLKAKAKARVKASWELSSGDRAGLVLSSYRCWSCIFPLNLGHKVVIWVMLSLQGAPPVDESCLGLMLAVVGRFQSWACNVSGWVTIVGHFVSWIILGLLVPFLGLGPDTQYSGCLKKD